MAVVREKKQGGGCCLVKLFMVLLIIVAVLIAGVVGGWVWLTKKADNISSSAPLKLTYPVATPEEIKPIRDKWIYTGTTGVTEPLGNRIPFTSDELNRLIGNDPMAALVKDRLFLHIKDGKAKVITSLPTAWEFYKGDPLPADAKYANLILDVEPDMAAPATQYLRLQVTGLKSENAGAKAEDLSFFKDFFNAIIKGIQDEKTTSGGYLIIEGNDLVIYKSAGAVSTRAETSATAPGAPGDQDPGPAATSEQLMDILHSTNPDQ